ncbi:MAG: glycoside hydrolase [Gemmatimonadota bacterium]|nr:glycoside hydrolase [Gemmatimonadota bacterium]
MRTADSHRALAVACLLVVIAFAAACGRDAVPAVTITALPSPVGAGAAEPFVATAPDGRVTLSWLARATDSSVALRFAFLDSTRTTWSEAREILRRTDLFVNWADFPSVVPLADGRLVAHWLQRNGRGTYAYDVRMSESLDEGATWSESALPHAPGIPAEHGFVSILPFADGGAGVTLLDGGAGLVGAARDAHPAMQLGYATWDDGRVTATRILDTRVCDCCQTASAMTSRGPVVVYRDRSDAEIRDMSVVRLVDGAWTEPRTLHPDGWEIRSCPVNGPAIGAMHDSVAAVWFTGAQDTARVRVAFSADAGATFGVPARVDGGLPTGRVDLEMLDGRTALVSWIERTGGDSAEVWVRVVRADGTMGEPAVVSPSSGARSSGFPRMTRVPGGAVIAWTVPGSPSTVKVAMVRVGAP